MKVVFIFLIVITLFSFSPVHSAEHQETSFPSLISSLRFSMPLTFCGEKVPIDRQDIKERLEKELLLALWDRPQVILWLKRSSRYLPIIETILKEHALPEDLKYIAIAESALRPHVSSNKGAIGFWQFMRQTGMKYGLTINKDIDERRNLPASTRAAVRYFKKLYRQFGSWTLAAAAYNMGEEGLMAEILEQETDNYYLHYLPIETQRFIFRIISTKLIFCNRQTYGFFLSKQDCYPLRKTDSIHLDSSQDIPIRVIARAAHTHFKVIKDLNPEIRGHYLTKGSHTIILPKGSAKGFHSRYQNLLTKWLASKKEFVYIVKKGDNLSSIAKKFNIPLTALIIWNKLDLKTYIHPGDRLTVFHQVMKNADTE